jgi:hypothetical protein
MTNFDDEKEINNFPLVGNEVFQINRFKIKETKLFDTYFCLE